MAIKEFTNNMFTIDSNVARRLTQAAVAAGAMAVISAGVAMACHPQGVIKKDVQNVTTGSASVAADTESSALVAHPADTLVYHITVANNATGDQDEMISTVITDQLPAGLTLVSQDSYNVGTVGMKKSVTRNVTVKVTASTAGTIKNQACFTGDSIDHKVPQKGCDLAYVKVVVPTPSPTPSPSPSKSPSPSPSPSKSPTPTPTTTPEGGKGEVLGTTLPDTGAPILGSTVGLSAMVAAGAAYIKSRRNR
jgi:uncharacterized repeat protein (TIGR01451 family)